MTPDFRDPLLECPRCGGRGRVRWRVEHRGVPGLCFLCDGAGRIPRSRLDGKRPGRSVVYDGPDRDLRATLRRWRRFPEHTRQADLIDALPAGDFATADFAHQAGCTPSEAFSFLAYLTLSLDGSHVQVVVDPDRRPVGWRHHGCFRDAPEGGFRVIVPGGLRPRAA